MGDEYLVHNLRVKINYTVHDVAAAVAAHFSLKPQEITNVHVVREGLDSRKKPCHVLTVSFRTGDHVPLTAPRYTPPQVVPIPLMGANTFKPVIVGAGPAGLCAAYLLARSGLQVTLLERGLDVQRRREAWGSFLHLRRFTPEGSLLWGEGGAGTFSDGKLTTRRNDPLLPLFLQILIEAGAPENIAVLAQPHLGTDILQKIIPNLRRNMEQMGVTFLWGHRVTDLHRRKSGIIEVQTSHGELEANPLFLATGGSSHELLPLLERHGAQIEGRALQMGVRMEQPAEIINRARYGRWAATPGLPTAAYNFTAGPVHTFCMCPGGEVVCSAGDPGEMVVNGMSSYTRAGKWSNTALITPLAQPTWRDALATRATIERAAFSAGGSNYNAPAQTISSFLHGTGEPLPDSSYRPGLTPASLREILPPVVVSALQQGLTLLPQKLRNVRDGLLIAPETRVTPPYRILRTDSGEIFDGCYYAGEGSGYSSGISTSAIDGLRIALSFISRHTAGSAT